MPAICRVCLEECTAIINLESIYGNSLPIIHMLKEFTIKDAEAKLSKYICYECAQRLNNAYRFKRQYEESMIKFMSMDSHYVVDLTFNENCLETKPKLHLNCDQEENQLQSESAIDAIHLNFNQNLDQVQESVNHSFCNQIKEQMPTESTIRSNCELSQNQINEETAIHSIERHLLQTELAVSSNERHLLQTESASSSNERDLLQLEPVVSLNENNVECLPKLRLRIFSCTPSQSDSDRLPMTLRSGRDLKISNKKINFKQQKMIAIPTHQRHTRPFGCNICNRWFKTKGHLFTHKNLHDELDIKCKNCRLQFLKRPHFKGHTCVP